MSSPQRKDNHQTPSEKSPQNNKKKQKSDACTDTADLDSLVDQMDVYIPLHISGDGINRALTRTDHHQRRASSAKNTARSTSSARPHSQQSSSNPRRRDSSTSTTTMNGSFSSSANPLANIPENFPVPATCSLSEIRGKLEQLLRSKVFLGFLDVRTGGLVELRADTMELFNQIPDQKKAIHCRKLKKEKTRSELMMEASSKNQVQDENDIPATAEGAHDDENGGGGRKRRKSVVVQDAPLISHEVVDEKAKKRERQAKQKEFVDRLVHDDVARREKRRKKLEEQMYPSESNPNNSVATVSLQHSKKKTQKEIDEALERLTNAESIKRRREHNEEKIRQQMIEEGYIVEPDQFRKISHENESERNERYYGRGVQWLRKHSDKVQAAQQKEKERKVPKLNKDDWNVWVEKRAKPLERDKFAAENQVVYVPYGTCASAVLRAQQAEKNGGESPLEED